jgi:hypothetical protein
VKREKRVTKDLKVSLVSKVLKVFKDQPEPMVRTVIPRLEERITGRPQTNRKLFRTF